MLNWGDKTICRYENGSIQDKAHNSLLLFLRKPENIRAYLIENEITLNDRQKEKLFAIVGKLEQDEEYRAGRKFFDHFFTKEPCEEEMPEGILSEDELAVLERIYNKFANFGSVDISNYSHKEKGYMETKKGEIISYAYAKDIELG